MLRIVKWHLIVLLRYVSPVINEPAASFIDIVVSCVSFPGSVCPVLWLVCNEAVRLTAVIIMLEH